MKFTSAKEIATKAAAIKAYLREAVAAEKAGMKVETEAPRVSRARGVEGEVPQRSAVQALVRGADAGAKQSGTRTARIEKAMPAIFEGRGFLERR